MDFFLDGTHKISINWISLKLRTSVLQNTIRGIKGRLPAGEKILAILISSKRFVSRIYKETYNLITEKQVF